MTVKKIVESKIYGFLGSLDCYNSIKDGIYRLDDGSHWRLDDSHSGREWNDKATVKDRKHCISMYYPRTDAVIMRDQRRFFLKIKGKGVRRQVVPVFLPDPAKYEYPPSK